MACNGFLAENAKNKNNLCAWENCDKMFAINYKRDSIFTLAQCCRFFKRNPAFKSNHVKILLGRHNIVMSKRGMESCKNWIYILCNASISVLTYQDVPWGPRLCIWLLLKRLCSLPVKTYIEYQCFKCPKPTFYCMKLRSKPRYVIPHIYLAKRTLGSQRATTFFPQHVVQNVEAATTYFQSPILVAYSLERSTGSIQWPWLWTSKR